ncbi:hypothetical protein TNCV_4403821 [Trichonephila clavipes]|uniref:Uncharacterized protein n=1 Tax=Trichonephila clavipes TaxID=2585209 RepID=A0A8X6S6T8_TRICX|nr:hypothetical protein TNCV_4403821 [Trichonephila clavipes]
MLIVIAGSESLEYEESANMSSLYLDCLKIIFLLLVFIQRPRAWLLNHLTPSLPVPTEDVSRVFNESSALEQVVVIHPGMTVEWAGFVSSQAGAGILPGNHVLDGESGQRPRARTYSGQGFP